MVKGEDISSAPVEPRSHFDVAIVGGGLVGAVAALCFARYGGAGLRVLVLERAGFDAPGRSGGRAYALSEGSRVLLDGLGLWDEMARFAQPITEIDITDSELETPFRPVFLNFSGEIEMGRPGAYIIEHERLAGPIYERLRAASGVTVHTSSALQGLEDQGAYAALQMGGADGAAAVDFTAGLVVGADGRNSKVRALSGIKLFERDYDQDGIVVTVKLSRPHGGKAVQHFLPAGPFAVLPLTGDRASLVWTEARGEAAAFCGMDDAAFIDEVNKRFSPKLGLAELAGPRGHFPLSLSIARSFTGERAVLIGDAAHGVHPLAGQGMNIGLRDVAALVEIVVETRRLGLDHGSEIALERYQQWRRFDGVMSAFAMDGLNRLFTSPHSSVRELRGFGLRLVDRLPPLKAFFVKEAAGLNGDVPKLMQGEAL